MFLVALGAWLIAPPALAADKPKTKQAKKQAKKKSKKPARETREGIARKLESFAESHVRSLNKNLRPNKTHIKVEKTENGYCAWYQEIDPATVKTELREKMKNDGLRYIGHILYIEHRLESHGATKKEALAGVFRQKKTWRKRELVRYDKTKWRY